MKKCQKKPFLMPSNEDNNNEDNNDETTTTKEHEPDIRRTMTQKMTLEKKPKK